MISELFLLFVDIFGLKQFYFIIIYSFVLVVGIKSFVYFEKLQIRFIKECLAQGNTLCICGILWLGLDVI